MAQVAGSGTTVDVTNVRLSKVGKAAPFAAAALALGTETERLVNALPDVMPKNEGDAPEVRTVVIPSALIVNCVEIEYISMKSNPTAVTGAAKEIVIKVWGLLPCHSR